MYKPGELKMFFDNLGMKEQDDAFQEIVASRDATGYIPSVPNSHPVPPIPVVPSDDNAERINLSDRLRRLKHPRIKEFAMKGLGLKCSGMNKEPIIEHILTHANRRRVIEMLPEYER